MLTLTDLPTRIHGKINADGPLPTNPLRPIAGKCRREQVRQAGNAVTPPAARDLVGVVAESLGVSA